MIYDKSVFLLDACCGIPRRRKFCPNGLIQDITQIDELREAKDSIIKQHLDKENLILITSDYRFAMKMLLSGKKIIFVEPEFDRDYFHIIYPSIKTGNGIFWKPETVELLQEKMSV